MRTSQKGILVIIAVLFAFGCGKKEDTSVANAKPEKPAQTETTAPKADVEKPQPAEKEEIAKPETKPATALDGLEWIKGNPVTFEPGKVYVVEFWATWCPPCKTSIPHLTEMQNKYKSQNVTIIGISTEPVGTIKPFVEKMGDQMNYTIASDAKRMADKNYMQAYGARGIPHAFIVDAKGNVVWNGHPMEEMEAILDLVVKDAYDPVAYAKQKAEQEALQKKLMAMYRDYFTKVGEGESNEATQQIAMEFIEKAPPQGLFPFAWDILTRLPKDKRDLQIALKAIQKANQLTDGQDPAVHEVYAMILFESGKAEEAVEAQQKAIDLLTDYPEAQKQLKEKLDKYKAAMPDQNI